MRLGEARIAWLPARNRTSRLGGAVTQCYEQMVLGFLSRVAVVLCERMRWVSVRSFE
jgi:hypothetical protein